MVLGLRAAAAFLFAFFSAEVRMLRRSASLQIPNL
jgi:hypothetical protein